MQTDLTAEILCGHGDMLKDGKRAGEIAVNPFLQEHNYQE